MNVGDSIEIIRPDDWHVHVRTGPMLRAVLPFTAAIFRRAIIMPNLPAPIVNGAMARSYREEILAALPPSSSFTPLMTLYLTDDTRADDVHAAFIQNDVVAAKLYPAHATTGSAHGVTDIARLDAVLTTMSRLGMPLLVHGESTDADVDVFDRERVFIDDTLTPLAARYPDLPIVFEHVTTKDAVDFVREGRAKLGATITPHHLVLNRTDMFRGGIRPHHYCLPVAKREHQRVALVDAALSGNERFFLGTDTAPHIRAKKESSCGCAGIFSAPVAMSVYAKVFLDENRVESLERFASRNGPKFYGLDENTDRLRITKVPWTSAASVDVEGEPVVIFGEGAEHAHRVELVPRGDAAGA